MSIIHGNLGDGRISTCYISSVIVFGSALMAIAAMLGVYYTPPPPPPVGTLECDPWVVRPIDADDYVRYPANLHECAHGDRSPSGCGDFVHNKPSSECVAFTHIMDNCQEHRFVTDSMVLQERMSRCFTHPLEYPGTEGIPPSVGLYRDEAAAWGNYDFLPPQRWLHNLADGGVVLLHSACLADADVNNLRQTAAYLRAQYKNTTGEDLRLLVSSYADLATPYAVVAWGNVFLSRCMVYPYLEALVFGWHRRAWNDHSEGGKYVHGQQMTSPVPRE